MLWRSSSLADDPYREWAPFYPPIAHNELMRVEESAMLALLPDVTRKAVLDAGSGTGRYARLVSERGAARVIGVDRSEAMLEWATKSAHRVRGDFSAVPLLSASVDVVLSGLAVMDVRDLTSAFIEWSRLLHSRGVVLCSTIHPRGKALGWTRTFETPAGKCRLPAHWHSVASFRSACARASLEIDAIEEPSLESAPREPVALIVRAHRRT